MAMKNNELYELQKQLININNDHFIILEKYTNLKNKIQELDNKLAVQISLYIDDFLKKSMTNINISCLESINILDNFNKKSQE